jgi:peptide-methionine (R)-S-oxide reductase
MNISRRAFAPLLIFIIATGGNAMKPSAKVKIFDYASGKAVLMDRVVKTDAEWKKLLTGEQFKIMRQKGTERACTGLFNDNHEQGVYRCAGCGIALFVSDAKFDSGTGWPSFFQPAANENITLVPDNSFGMSRTEVNCALCGSHLGHVFDDGPAPTHRRYCINSAALNFVKK